MAVLDTIAPFDSAEEWDNVGLMVGDMDRTVSSVLVALDPSLEVIISARESGADLILTHHPLMIRPISRIDLQEVLARKIAMLIEARMNLVSMHTNLDKAPGGVADELARRLGLGEVKAYGAMRVGALGSAVPLAGFLGALPFRCARICDAGRPVRTVAACPGSGMEYWQQAQTLGCDTFVTGDVRYHAGIDALEAGMNVVDLGHFGTEEIIVKPLTERLRHDLKGVAVNAHAGSDAFSLYHN